MTDACFFLGCTDDPTSDACPECGRYTGAKGRHDEHLAAMKITAVDSRILRELHRIALGEQCSRHGGICGQAFTDYTCMKCAGTFSYHNTNTPNFCPACTKELMDGFKAEISQRSP